MSKATPKDHITVTLSPRVVQRIDALAAEETDGNRSGMIDALLRRILKIMDQERQAPPTA